MKFVLCGMMASGKTTVGRLLADVLGLPFVDTDEWIAARYGDISAIFAQQGEGEFRLLEGEAVRELSALNSVVLATGGGVVLSKENVAALKKDATIIWLRADASVLVQRLQGDQTRPLLQGDAWQEDLANIERARRPLYLAAADIIIDVDGKTPQQIVQEIVEITGRKQS